MAPCAVWLLLYYALIPAGEGAGFVLFPMLLLCGAGAHPAVVVLGVALAGWLTLLAPAPLYFSV